MVDERRGTGSGERRAKPRGGRRAGDAGKPWYMRRRLWLGAASLVFVGWKRVRSLGKRESPHTDVAV